MKINIQPISKLDPDNAILSVVEIFKTIQGEGPNVGKPAVFIRLGGCNLQCPHCDTDYTSNSHKMYWVNIINIVMMLAKPPHLIVITGGEPFRQNITNLANKLLYRGFSVQIETNGTLPPSPQLHRGVEIICSPKTGSINKHIAERMNGLKYVIDAKNVSPDDGLPTLALNHTLKGVVARPPEGYYGPVYILPADEQDDEINHKNLLAAIDCVHQTGHTLQLQLHKIIGLS